MARASARHPCPPCSVRFCGRQVLSCIQLALACGFTLSSFAFAEFNGSCDKLPFQGIHILRMSFCPFTRLCQTSTAIQDIRLTLHGQPFLGCLGKLAVQAQSLAIILQPTTQGRPFADQCLMCYLDRVLTGGDQACICTCFQYCLRGLCFFRFEDQLFDCRPSSSITGGGFIPQLG